MLISLIWHLFIFFSSGLLSIFYSGCWSYCWGLKIFCTFGMSPLIGLGKIFIHICGLFSQSLGITLEQKLLISMKSNSSVVTYFYFQNFFCIFLNWKSAAVVDSVFFCPQIVSILPSFFFFNTCIIICWFQLLFLFQLLKKKSSRGLVFLSFMLLSQFFLLLFLNISSYL